MRSNSCECSIQSKLGLMFLIVIKENEKDFQEVFDILQRSVTGLVKSLEVEINAN